MSPSEHEKMVLKSKSQILLKDINEPVNSHMDQNVQEGLTRVKSKTKLNRIDISEPAIDLDSNSNKTLGKTKSQCRLKNNEEISSFNGEVVSNTKQSSQKIINKSKSKVSLKLSDPSNSHIDTHSKIHLLNSMSSLVVDKNSDQMIPKIYKESHKSPYKMSGVKSPNDKNLRKTRSKVSIKDENGTGKTIHNLPMCNKMDNGDADDTDQLERTLSLVELDHNYDSPKSASVSPKLPKKVSSILKSNKSKTSPRRKSRRDLQQFYQSQTPQSTKVGRIAFDEESVYYFKRAQGCCSVPRDGANSIGMDMKHAFHEKKKISETDPAVKRKLFNFPNMAKSETNDSSDNGIIKSLHAVASCPQLCPEIDEDDIEISFKGFNKQTNNGVKDEVDAGITFVAPLDQSKVKVSETICDVPDRNLASQSAAFKRSLSRSFSEDSLSPRRISVTQYPPTKAHKSTFTIPEVLTLTPPDEDLRSSKGLVSHRSSSRLQRDQHRPSTGNLLNNNIWPLASFQQTTPKSTGKIGKRPDSVRKSALKGGLSKAVSKVDLKLDENNPIVNCLDKPNPELAKTISTNSLSSFKSYHSSPEEEKGSLENLVKNCEQKNCKQIVPLVNPSNNYFENKRGNNSKKQTPKKKVGESGTRGLTPMTPRARFSLLKANGIEIGQVQDDNDMDRLRESRDKCGCSCPEGRCIPETCECALNEIECQVERPGFPCQCVSGQCQNPQGRREFNEMEVSMHFIDTMMNMKGILDITAEEDSLKS